MIPAPRKYSVAERDQNLALLLDMDSPRLTQKFPESKVKFGLASEPHHVAKAPFANDVDGVLRIVGNGFDVKVGLR